MKTVPNFQVGDRVRVMQTKDMVAAGIANTKGVIVLDEYEENGEKYHNIYCIRDENTYRVPTNSLMLLNI